MHQNKARSVNFIKLTITFVSYTFYRKSIESILTSILVEEKYSNDDYWSAANISYD